LGTPLYRQSQPHQQGCYCPKLHKSFALGAACIFWAGPLTCTWSVRTSIQWSWNEN